MRRFAITRLTSVVLFLVAGASLAVACGPGDGQVRDRCREGCNDLNTFDCVDGDTIKACNDQCALSTSAIAEEFADCSEAAGLCSRTNCLSILGIEPGETGPDEFTVGLCKDACNELTECSSTDETSNCLSTCETTTQSNAEAFQSCVRITKTCQENRECYTSIGL